MNWKDPKWSRRTLISKLQVLGKIGECYNEDSWNPIRDLKATSAEDAAEVVPTRLQSQ
jgi:hypothetical protein